MENHLQLVLQGHYFHLFYNFAFFSAMCILLFEGHKRKFPMMRWILLLAFSWVSFVAGSKVITITPEDWSYFFRNFSLPEAPNKNLLGGLIAGTFALIAGKYLFRFKPDFSDTFAYALPIGVAIQRVGCFLTGCCHGTLSELPLAIQYPVDSLSHFHHYQNNLITINDQFSLPVHPAQLYETVGCLIVILILFRFRKYLKASGSFLLSSLILFSVEHFIVQFFRDPLAHTRIIQTEGILNQVQWIVIILIILLSSLLFWRELNFKDDLSERPQADISVYGSIIIILFGISGLWPLRNWFTISEIISLLLLMVIGIGFLATRIFLNANTVNARWALITSLCLPLLLMSQNYRANDVDSALIRQFKTISIGAASGNYFNTHTVGRGDGCDRVEQTGYFQQKYILGGAGLSLTNENTETGEYVNYGLKAMFGQHKETRLNDNFSDTETIWGLTPFFKYDRRWLGLGLGVHFGNLTFTTENRDIEGQVDMPERGTVKTSVYPQAHFRIGPRELIFTDFHIAEHFPSALPGFRYQFGIGSGFGDTNGLTFRAGTTGITNAKGGMNALDINGIYASGYIPVQNIYVFEPMMIYNYKPFERSGPEIPKTNNGFQISLGVSYRFGHRTK